MEQLKCNIILMHACYGSGSGSVAAAAGRTMYRMGAIVSEQQQVWVAAHRV